ncbi:protein stunted [Drosophila gunungcola]|uniref:protein stunted n=1 Tax=Drosophila gunungcola TaxID=103775 RepID=UPI0022E7CDE0|nr:protein stunted [Drosophila gunungcola]XP_052856724.1 protein stunted [Drosophila gunungcola]
MKIWRDAGLTYIHYSNIAARVVREALRAELRADAAKRDISHVTFTPWVNGKPKPRKKEESKS